MMSYQWTTATAQDNEIRAVVTGILQLCCDHPLHQEQTRRPPLPPFLDECLRLLQPSLVLAVMEGSGTGDETQVVLCHPLTLQTLTIPKASRRMMFDDNDDVVVPVGSRTRSREEGNSDEDMEELRFHLRKPFFIGFVAPSTIISGGRGAGCRVPKVFMTVESGLAEEIQEYSADTWKRGGTNETTCIETVLDAAPVLVCPLDAQQQPEDKVLLATHAGVSVFHVRQRMCTNLLTYDDEYCCDGIAITSSSSNSPHSRFSSSSCNWLAFLCSEVIDEDRQDERQTTEWLFLSKRSLTWEDLGPSPTLTVSDFECLPMTEGELPMTLVSLDDGRHVLAWCVKNRCQIYDCANQKFAVAFSPAESSSEDKRGGEEESLLPCVDREAFCHVRGNDVVKLLRYDASDVLNDRKWCVVATCPGWDIFLVPFPRGKQQ